MKLWRRWNAWVEALRPACTRQRTFHWMRIALMGLCVRFDLAGVTSLVRALALQPKQYLRLLHLFHTEALALGPLTALWVRLCQRHFDPLEIGGARVCLADGIKVAKEGRKMPGVKKLHQESTNNSKPEWIEGHSFQALAQLVRSPDGRVTSVPLTARIHEGVVDSARELRRTLLDRVVDLFFEIANEIPRRVLLVADAYFASGKVIRPLLDQGHHLVTRVRRNAVAYEAPASRRRRGPGRPRKYGKKRRLQNLLQGEPGFLPAPSPVYDESNVEIHYATRDLLWRPAGQLVRFVFVRHPHRGELILMTTDLTLDPLDVITLYGYRFQIEVGFRQAVHVLGAYAYHFWMFDMPARKRGSGNQDIRKRSTDYKNAVRRKIGAYHRFVQLACIAQGLLKLLAIEERATVWQHFRSWLRTMNPDLPPSELVVIQALRTTLPGFLADSHAPADLVKFLARIRSPDILRAYESAA